MSILAQSAASPEVEPAMLLSVVKPILALIPFVLYVWITGSRLDKDARYFQIDPARWALIFAIVPILALACVLVIPIFWIGWPLSILMMGGTVLAYAAVRNPRVPEAQRWNLGALKIGESVQARKAASAQKSARLRFLDAGKRERPVPLKDDPRHAVHMAVESLLEPLVDNRASRLDLAPTQQGFVSAHVVDGLRYRRDPMPPDLATTAIDY